MLKINTERLNILPLNKYNLGLCISKYGEVERSLGLTFTDKKLFDREKSVYY